MATPLEITYRKAGVEYHQERLAEFGGWDADATDATLGRSDFSEVRNFRRPTTGDLEVRTGIIEHELASTSGATLLAKCEYRGDFNGTDTFFDVSLFYQSGGVSIGLLEPISGTQRTILVDAAGTNAESWVQQYAYSLIITIKGVATYEVAPTSNTLTSWTVTKLGKDAGPTPTVVRFAPKTQGDLYLIDNTGPTEHRSPFSSSIKKDPNEPGQPLLVPLNINADYWSVVGNGNFSLNDPPIFVSAKQDAAVNIFPAPAPKNSFGHNMTRAWGYRFVAVQEFTNAKGEKYRVRSAPSVDLWVADIMYAPAQWGPKLQNDFLVATFPISGSGGVHYFDFDGVTVHSNNGVRSFPLPSQDDFDALQLKVIDGGKIPGLGLGHDDAPVPDAPYYWIAKYFGFRAQSEIDNDEDISTFFYGQTPYLDTVPASKLKGAPMTFLTWSEFSKPTGTIEIEVYRTTHSEPDDKDNVTKDPNFETHRYGYVGSLLAPLGSEDPTFTDDIVDDAIDFGTTPEQQDGLLRGQFSGSISRDFDNRLVIGDIITDYTVLAPATFDALATTCSFFFRVDETKVTSGYGFSDFAPTQKVRFGVAYVDNNSIQSPMTDLGPPLDARTPQGNPVTPRKFWVSINLPRGYAANVTTARIFRGYLNSSGGIDWTPTGANPTAGLIATVKIDAGQGNYLSKNDEAAVAGSIVGETHISTNPGAIIYSQPNQINFWPPLNFEVHHQFAPVRLLEVVLGPLYVGTDQSISLTELNGRREELTRRIGPISRHAWQKVDKIVFMLTPYGVYYIESSGVVQFPANVQTAILPYLQETIPGVLPLANARRAAIGFLGERNEVHLHLPSSKLLGGALPHRTIVYKLGSGNNPRETVNYEFDLTPRFERGDLPSVLGLIDNLTKYRPEQVIFQTRAMGGLFAGFYWGDSNELQAIDCDAQVPWIGSAVLEKSWNIGAPNVKKSLREIIVRTSGTAKISLSTGQPAGLGDRSHKYGTMHQRARIFPVTNPKPPLRHIISGSVIETTATAPIARIWSEPDINGDHSLHVNAIDIFAIVLNNHP